MRLTSKGQVTIPKEIREKLGVRPGDEICFREEGQQILLVNQDHAAPSKRQAGESDGDYLVRALQEFGRQHLIIDELSGQSVDDIMNDLRGYAEDENDPGFQRRS